MTHPEEPAPLHARLTNERPRQGEGVIRWVAPVSSKIPRTKHGLLA